MEQGNEERATLLYKWYFFLSFDITFKKKKNLRSTFIRVGRGKIAEFKKKS